MVTINKIPKKSSTLKNIDADDNSVKETEMLPTTVESSIYAANEVAARLRVDTRAGLTWTEANHRAKFVGHNELNAKEEDPTWKKYAQQFQNPLILLLLGKLLYLHCYTYTQ